MSRPAPEFAVGEAVIVVAADNSFRFEAIVLSIYQNFFGQIIYRVTNDPLPPHPGWDESTLRKKPRFDHIAATESFDQLLQGLKRPQGVVV